MSFCTAVIESCQEHRYQTLKVVMLFVKIYHLYTSQWYKCNLWRGDLQNARTSRGNSTYDQL